MPRRASQTGAVPYRRGSSCSTAVTTSPCPHSPYQAAQETGRRRAAQDTRTRLCRRLDGSVGDFGFDFRRAGGGLGTNLHELHADVVAGADAAAEFRSFDLDEPSKVFDGI
jgi:hypothetical protein